MKPDSLGFLYPSVDESSCIGCGLCKSVCAFKPGCDCLKQQVQTSWAVRHKDVDQVMKSRSGGVFAAISDYVLELGGVVYGVGYDDHFRVVHRRADTKVQRDDFRGSKYVQSDLSGHLQTQGFAGAPVFVIVCFYLSFFSFI